MPSKKFAIEQSWRLRALNKSAIASAIFLGAFIITAIIVSIFTPVSPSDAYRVATVLNSSGYTINLSASSQVDMNIAATADGVYASAKDTLNIKTTAPGYVLYLSMNNDDTDGNRLYKDGLNTSTDYLAPVSGTFSSPATLTNNSWGFAIAGDGGTFDTSYQTPTPAITSKWAAVPIRSNAVAIHTATTANPDPGDNIDIYYGVKANTALPSGVYSNTISYSAVANGTSLDVAAISPERTDRLKGGEQVTITTSLNTDAANVGNVSVYIGGEVCTSPVVSNGTSGNVIIKCNTPPHDTGVYDVTVDIPTYNKTYYIAGGIEYYAVPPPFDGITTMQDMTTEICANSAVGDKATLTDTRDNNTYTVRKMEDGKCWMTQNLRLGSTSSALTLTSADSDVTSNFTIPTSAVQTSGTTDWSGTVDAVHVYNNGDRWIQPTSSGSNATVNTTGTPDTQSKYIGNYYNWYTATAGTGLASMLSGNATSSICPKGWKLPTSGSTTAGFSNLTQALVQVNTDTSSVPDKSFTMQSAPNYFVLSGYYVGGVGVNFQGSAGYWWSRTARNRTLSYNLLLSTTSVFPQNNSDKYYGFSVRCIAQ